MRKNLGRVDVLLEVAGREGLPLEEARQVLADRTFSTAVDQDWARAHALGVTGVPTFVCGRYGVVGAQPYEELERLVREAGASPVEESRD